jgi:hypothetical protein
MIIMERNTKLISNHFVTTTDGTVKVFTLILGVGAKAIPSVVFT